MIRKNINTKVYGSCKPLTKEEEAEACRRKDAGDQQAFNRLVEAVVPYAIDLARQYSRRSTDGEDMAQVAILAVIGAIPRFDAKKGRLTTFVTSPIIWALLNSRDNYFSAVHVPRWNEKKRINRASEFPKNAVPAVDSHEDEVDDNEESQERLASVRYVMNDMPERWCSVLLKRCQGLSLKEIGDEMGLTKERVRQLVLRATQEVQYRLALNEVGAQGW
jgi:RNA polymerase sigma factor (sigma-70 family)